VANTQNKEGNRTQTLSRLASRSGWQVSLRWAPIT